MSDTGQGSYLKQGSEHIHSCCVWPCWLRLTVWSKMDEECHGCLQTHAAVGMQYWVLKSSELLKATSRTTILLPPVEQHVYKPAMCEHHLCTLLTAAPTPPALWRQQQQWFWPGVPAAEFTVLPTAAVPLKHQDQYLKHQGNPGITRSRNIQKKTRRCIWINWFLLFLSLPIPCLHENMSSAW